MTVHRDRNVRENKYDCRERPRNDVIGVRKERIRKLKKGKRVTGFEATLIAEARDNGLVARYARLHIDHGQDRRGVTKRVLYYRYSI